MEQYTRTLQKRIPKGLRVRISPRPQFRLYLVNMKDEPDFSHLEETPENLHNWLKKEVAEYKRMQNEFASELNKYYKGLHPIPRDLSEAMGEKRHRIKSYREKLTKLGIETEDPLPKDPFQRN